MSLLGALSGGGKKVASLYAELGVHDNATTALQGFKGALSATAMSSVASFGLIAGAVASVGAGIAQAAQEGAKLQRIQDAGTELAKQFGGDMDLIVEKVQAASLGTVSRMDIIQSANRAMLLGLGADANQLADLMQVAAFRARAMGEDTTKAFNDIVLGLGRQSPKILDNLGIVVDANKAYKDYADSIGISASELTKAQKTQALMNEVISQGNDMLDKAGGLADDNAAKIERLNTMMKDAADATKLWTASTLANAIIGQTDQEATLSKQTMMIEYLSEKYKEGSFDIQNYTQDLATIGLTTEQATQMMRDGFIEAADAVSQHGAALDGDTQSFQDNSAAMQMSEDELKDYEKTLYNQVDMMVKITDMNKDYATSQNEITQKQAELKAQIDEAVSKYGAQSQKVKDLQKDYDNLSKKYTENADKHKEATNKIIYDMAIQKIAMQDGVAGFSEAEEKKALAMASTLGIVEQTALKEQIAIDKATTAYANGAISAEQFAKAVTMIQSGNYDIHFNITATGMDIITQIGNVVYGSTGNRIPIMDTGVVQRYASGGSFVIPAGYGYEGFNMGGMATASAGERVTITPSGQAASQAPFDYDRLIGGITIAVRDAIQGMG